MDSWLDSNMILESFHQHKLISSELLKVWLNNGLDPNYLISVGNDKKSSLLMNSILFEKFDLTKTLLEYGNCKITPEDLLMGSKINLLYTGVSV